MSLTPQDASALQPTGYQSSLFQTPESGVAAGGVFATPFIRVLQGWQGRSQSALDQPASEPSFRHGSAAPGSARRIRTPRGERPHTYRGRGETRNRGNSGLSPVSTSGQVNSPRRDEPSGPEEENHWGVALVQVAEAIQTIERTQRQHATEIAIGNSRISELQSQVDSSTVASDTAIAATNSKLDIVECHSLQTRAYLQEMSVNIVAKYATLEWASARLGQFTTNLDAVASWLTPTEQRLDQIESDIRLIQSLGKPPDVFDPRPLTPGLLPNDRPVPTGGRTPDELEGQQNYLIGTPPNHHAVPAGSPFASHKAQMFQPITGSIIVQDEQLPAPIGAHGPQDPSMRPAFPMTQPGRSVHESPLSFSGTGHWNADRSHSVNNAALQMGPPRYSGGVLPMGAPQPQPMNAPQPQYAGYQVPMNNLGQAPSPFMGQPQYAQPQSRDERGMMGNLEAMSRKSESLRRFSGNSADFTNWSEHFMDHMSRVHVTWRGVLQYISTCSEDLSLSRLRQDLLGPNQEPAHELAMKLEQTIIDWMPESLYKRRVQLCGGKSETGNGFLMWRRLLLSTTRDRASSLSSQA